MIAGNILPENLTYSPSPGFGLGLRPEHYSEFLDQSQPVDWLEIISENYMVSGGKPIHMLDSIRADYPVVMHGVSMSVGSADPIDRDYLGDLKALAARIEPLWVSDHLCWTGVNAHNSHDLLPLPYDEITLDRVVDNIKQVQDFLGRRLVIENPSSYVQFRSSTITEWEFLAEMAKRADCLLLLDVNNIYVSGRNHNFDPLQYLNALPAERIQQIHLAGHSDMGDYIIDTHDAPICDDVWALYRTSCELFGDVPAMVERDDKIPPLKDLIAELDHAREIAAEVRMKSLEQYCA